MKYFQLLRIKHWVKNLLIFFPLIFSGKLFNQNESILVLSGFFCFSAVASIVYIYNDFKDIEKDRNHPSKRYRPLASGAISMHNALKCCVILAVIGAALLMMQKYMQIYSFWIMGAGCIVLYFIINIIYTGGGGAKCASIRYCHIGRWILT